MIRHPFTFITTTVVALSVVACGHQPRAESVKPTTIENKQIAQTDSRINHPAHCQTVSEAEIRQLFTRWNNSLKTLDPAKVTANYSADAVLLPTVSNQPRTNHAEIKNYFEHFLLSKPVGTINQSHIKIGCNKAYDVGVYTFQLTDPTTGKKSDVKARYSYVYVYDNNQWLISHHHSSAMPEKLTTDSQKKNHH